MVTEAAATRHADSELRRPRATARRFSTSPLLATAFAAATLLTPAAAVALVTEPNGATVPTASGGGETQLFQLFANRGEPIDWQVDAVTVPETFSPLCEFSAEFLLREAGGQFPLGWYNVDPAATFGPPASQIHEVVACNTAPGAMITSQTIRNDPAYTGGLVGFALANGSGCVSFNNPGSVNLIHYTESRFNVKFAGNPATPWFMALVYDSKVEANAFYVAFEDGNVNPFSFNNDGDFNDFVVLLKGLVCAGGGGPCETGNPGVCGPGIEVCRNGMLACEGVVPAGTESCDGLDNDCNGIIDDGDLCAAGEICDNGVCVQQCNTGEFKCPVGKTCRADGYCVDEACAMVSCGPGEICVAGTCQGACDGIACPHGQVCRLGACVNPCTGITCAANEYCLEGVCRPLCDCNPCGAGFECDPTSLICVPAGCLTAGCAAGQHCETGIGCVDDCASAVCPKGQTCTAGNCVADPGADAGTAGTGGVGGTFTSDAGFVGGTGGTSGSAGAATGGTSSGSGGTSGSRGSPATSESGCGCSVPRARGSALVAFAALGLWLLRRRRAPR